MVVFEISTATVFFWVGLLLIGWTYVGYLLFLKLVSVVRPQTVVKEDITPPVTMVVTAHNEAVHIEKKIENCLAVDYPRDKLEIIIVSDASDDGTDDIVKSFADRCVQLLRIPEHRGKHFGQGRGIEMAANEIIVLSDATTFLKADAVRKIVRSYADPKIGVVSGEDVIPETEHGPSGEGAYVRYEMKLRSLEAAAGSLVGVSGCFFSVRKKLAETWVDDMSSDFYMPIVAYLKGYRTVPEPEAICYYQVLGDPAKEFRRKVRTVLHGLEVLFMFKQILNPCRYGFYSLQMASHKLLRWLVPFFLLIVLIANGALVNDGLFYRLTLLGQFILYGMAILAYAVPELQEIAPFRIPLFFCIVNLSIVGGWYQYFRGEKQVVWTPTKR
jgi:cellulose synthase/poly-beta-1,6-N-acetylglucosamine synthase-like glycosyltransferase